LAASRRAALAGRATSSWSTHRERQSAAAVGAAVQPRVFGRARRSRLDSRSYGHALRTPVGGSVFAPPGDELVEVDQPVVVAVDLGEAGARLGGGDLFVERVHHGDELVELDLAVRIGVVVLE